MIATWSLETADTAKEAKIKLQADQVKLKQTLTSPEVLQS